MEFKCCGKRERVNSPCLGAFSGGRQLSESPAVAADRADPHAARPNPPGHRNSWKSSSQGGWRSIPGSNPHVLGRSLGLALQEQAGPGTQLLSPPPCSDRCHFSPPLVSKCFLRQLLVIIGIFFFPPPFPPWLLLPVPALRQRGRKCIRWGLPRPVPHPSAEHGACICLALRDPRSSAELPPAPPARFSKITRLKQQRNEWGNDVPGALVGTLGCTPQKPRLESLPAGFAGRRRGLWDAGVLSSFIS